MSAARCFAAALMVGLTNRCLIWRSESALPAPKPYSLPAVELTMNRPSTAQIPRASPSMVFCHRTSPVWKSMADTVPRPPARIVSPAHSSTNTRPTSACHFL